jgi:hypothetical protein
MDVKLATKAYEVWLSKKIPLIEADLKLKHQRMAEDVFQFLRATFYRWAQLWPEACPELVSLPSVLGVGDLHVENFGTWRDWEGRLIWGVNDFDEVCEVPYAVDLVRLATSANIAISEGTLSCDPQNACGAILTGYTKGIEKGGQPFVLAEHHRWLRDLAQNELRDPTRYWDKLKQWPVATKLPPDIRGALVRALPESRLPFRVVHRQAGLGSLGRRRFTLLAEWRDGFIAREAKELTQSAWGWSENRQVKTEIFYKTAIDHAVRVSDPMVSLHQHWLIRRLAPDCRRIELNQLPTRRNGLKLLYAMGFETANIHLGTKSAAKKVGADLRDRHPKWLFKAAEAMKQATIDDWKHFHPVSASRGPRSPKPGDV